MAGHSESATRGRARSKNYITDQLLDTNFVVAAEIFLVYLLPLNGCSIELTDLAGKLAFEAQGGSF